MILVAVLPRCRNRCASWPKCPGTRVTMPPAKRISKQFQKTEAQFTCLRCRSEWTTPKQTKTKKQKKGKEMNTTTKNRGLKIKTSIKAGGFTTIHNETLVRD